ncbi:MAG: AmmeMemoRadiSam system radical SAM enzyme [Candidatus Cloacimonas sp. 4484_275]|nr:MAG: AmmeMemoRadiSam system radical SAM enzyme [Candidatus Cloacimonas sp. 4484_275]
MKKAKYYKKLRNNNVQCLLCPHYCVLAPQETAKCLSRKNIDGELWATNYAETVTVSIDPMEKKPLYHFFPGRNILSVGSNSCNFSCSFCQNYSISQFPVPTQKISPETLAQTCKKYKTDFVAFTYTEPITWFEFVLDTAKILHEQNIKTVFVTNGFINPEPLAELLPHIDAFNIDLKSMNDDFYRKFCDGRVQPVLQTIKTVAKFSHLEVTNLLITGENDSEKDIEQLVDFIAEINPNIPLHFSKYFPHFKMNNPPTSESTLYQAFRLAKEKLNYVYLGNILTDNDTRCPHCDAIIIKRGFRTEIKIENGKCKYCGMEIYGKFE